MGRITADAIRIKISQIIRNQMHELQWNGIKIEIVEKIDYKKGRRVSKDHSYFAFFIEERKEKISGIITNAKG